jgi:signal transduction histidine kinase
MPEILAPTSTNTFSVSVSPIAARLLAASALGIAGFWLNTLPIELFDNLDLMFGNLAFVIAAYLFGPWYALFTAVIAVAGLVVSSDSFSIYLLFIPEALVLGYCRRRQWFLLYGDLAVNILYGAPLTYLIFLLGAPGVSELAPVVILKHIINGAAYTSIALLLVLLLPHGKFLKYLSVASQPVHFQAQLRDTITLIVTLALVLTALLLTSQLVNRLEKASQAELHLSAGGFKDSIEAYLQRHSQAVTNTAQMLSLAPPDNRLRQQQLTSLHTNYPSFRTMLITDQTGQISLASPASLMTQLSNNGVLPSLEDRDYFQIAMNEQRPYISAVFRGRGFGNEAIVAVSAPLYLPTSAGSPVGVLEGSLDVSKFDSIANRAGESATDNTFVVVDAMHQVIYASAPLGLNPLEAFSFLTPTGRTANSTPRLTLSADANSPQYLYVSENLANNWQIYALQPLALLVNTIKQQYLLTCLLLLAGLILIYITVERISLKLTRPLADLVDSIHQPLGTEVQTSHSQSLDDVIEITALRDNIQSSQQLQLARQQSLESEVAEQTHELRSNAARWQYALEAFNGGVWDWNMVTDELYLSPQAMAMVVQVDPQVESKPSNFDTFTWSSPTEDRERLRCALVDHLAGRKPAFVCEYRRRGPGGRWFWYHTEGKVISYLPDGKPERMTGIETDISQRVAEEEALRRSAKMSALGTLTGGIAHDYNNMLSVILGYTDLLADLANGKPQIPAEAANELNTYLQEIQKAGSRGEHLTQKLLAFSQFKPLAVHRLDLNEVLNNSRTMLATSLTGRNQLSLDLAPSVWPIEINQSDLEDVLVNLSINAMQAMPAGGQLRMSTINISLGDSPGSTGALAAGDYILLEIEDTGTGIDEDNLSKVFDPYFTTKEQGTGLGLSQAYGLMRRCGGDIRVSSERGHGTRFSLYFPRASSIQENPSAAAKAPHKHEHVGHEQILVVDDDPSIRQMTSRLLGLRGYDVLVAEGGAAALAILASGTVDLMISDIIMPGMDGKELAETCQQRYPSIKILLVSGYNEHFQPGETASKTQPAFLQKPYKSATLFALIRQLLDE